MKSYKINIMLAGFAAGLMGCTTVPETYKPTTLGPCKSALADRGLEMRIEARSRDAEKGQPIVFDITYTNVGVDPFLLPDNPEVLFVWTYANGKRDNYMVDRPISKFYSEDDVLTLAPGETLKRKFAVKTYYFKRMGITEFRAILQGVPNSNPNLDGVWLGHAISNAYGVMVDDRGSEMASTANGKPLATLAL
jgi:hypothetical protein